MIRRQLRNCVMTAVGVAMLGFVIWDAADRANRRPSAGLAARAHPTVVELRFANRFFVGRGYRQNEGGIKGWLPGASQIADYNEGFRVERHSEYFATLDDCEKAKTRMERKNPALWWARCRI